MTDASTWSVLIPVVVALASGGMVAAIARWRPEATTASVAASDVAVRIMQGQLERIEKSNVALTARVASLETLLGKEKDLRIRAERGEAAAIAKYEAEHERRLSVEVALGTATGGRRSTPPPSV